MAEMLKRENDILTLKVQLAPGDQVSCVLQYLENDRLQDMPLWVGSIAEFGISVACAGPVAPLDELPYTLPAGLRDGLARGFAELMRMTPWREPALWVHLVKPYGLLRFVPWERHLPDIVGAPVLMLPDFIFPPPRKSASGLDIALCASAPLHCEDHHVFEALQATIDSTLQGLEAQSPRLHVFTDRDMGRRLFGGSIPDNVRIHDQADAAPYVVDDPSFRVHDQSGSLRSPWLLWMRDALRAYSTDIVHFVCHGHLSAHSGAMLFAQSPLERTDNYLAGPVGATELASFLTQVGAWSTGFSSPSDNHSPAGLRGLADEIAQSMPGPMMLFDGRHGTANDLANGYRFVHGEGPQSPPRSRGLYLYCQPYLLAADRGVSDGYSTAEATKVRIDHYARNASQRFSALHTLTSPDLHAAARTPPDFLAGKSISAVTAATERFSEKVQLQYQRLMRDEVIPDEIAHRDMQASMATVDLIRQAVNQIEQQRLATDIEADLDRIEVGAAGAVPAAATAEMPITVDSEAADFGGIHEKLALLAALQSEASPGSDPTGFDVTVRVDASSLEQRTSRLEGERAASDRRLLHQAAKGAEP